MITRQSHHGWVGYIFFKSRYPWWIKCLPRIVGIVGMIFFEKKQISFAQRNNSLIFAVRSKKAGQILSKREPGLSKNFYPEKDKRFGEGIIND